jgi:hypothetical protein
MLLNSPITGYQSVKTDAYLLEILSKALRRRHHASLACQAVNLISGTKKP